MLDWTAIRSSLLSSDSKSPLPPHVKIPVLPLAITKFSQRADDPNAHPRELGEIIQTDMGLTCELLRYVNSSAIGLRNKASSAQHAITLMGIRESKLFLLTNAVKRSMKTAESKLINVKNFWASNLERSLFAREIAKLLKTDTELAFAAGMLQDFLLPILTNELYPAYLRFTKEQLEQPINLAEFERTSFPWDHAEAAAHIMVKWSFPDDLISCVYLHHRGLSLLNDPKLGKTAAAAAAVSAMMPGPLKQVADGMDQLVRLDAAWPAFNLLEVAGRVEEQYQQISPGPPNSFSFLRLCQKTLAANCS